MEALAIPGAAPPLMERAGQAAAELALALLEPGAPVLVACGPGNNGGDGFVMARLLHAAGHPVDVLCAADPARLPADAAAAREAWQKAGGRIWSAWPAAPSGGWGMVVDALFGIGLQRPLEGLYADWITRLNDASGWRLALDIPSGLDGNRGCSLGPCFQADHTLTFIALKPGLLTLDGPDQCGELHLAPLGLDPEGLAPPSAWEIRPALFSASLQPRQRNSHKGSYGDVAVIGGAPGMVGAALLAGRAAAWLGAGRVLVGLQDAAALAVDLLRPELMFRPAATLLEQPGIAALAVGPGLGQSAGALALLRRAVATPTPLLLDADALNLVAADGGLQEALPHRGHPTLLTPHPAEAGRLLGISTATVQAGRVDVCKTLAHRFQAWVVLKGCGSIIAGPEGEWWINGTGNPAMATAGMGDVLSGLTAALLARGWTPRDALLAGVHLHGAAGDLLQTRLGLDCGLLADELAAAARTVFNDWVQRRKPAP